jgi:hypothetical protein
VSTQFQIAVDCADPHRLNQFWAAAMGYEVEDNQDQIKKMMDAGYAGDDDVTEFEGRIVWKTGAACNDPDGTRPRLLFQTVPEPKTVKNRVHLDLHVGADRRPAELERLLALGATKLWEGQEGPNTWITLADPEGNEFCLS